MSTKNTKKFKNFSDALTWVLEEVDVAQSELARRVNTDHSVINRYVNNKSVPQPRTMKRIAKALGVTISQLQDGQFKAEIQEKPMDDSIVEEKIAQYRRKAGDQDTVDSDLDLMISVLKDHAQSLVKGLDVLEELERRRSNRSDENT